jgi:hypothetical protein
MRLGIRLNTPTNLDTLESCKDTAFPTADGFTAPNVSEQILLGQTLEDHLNKIASDGNNNIIVRSLPSGQQRSDVIMQEYSTRPTDATALEGGSEMNDGRPRVLRATENHSEPTRSGRQLCPRKIGLRHRKRRPLRRHRFKVML